jgi:DNA ligase-1
MNDGYLDRRKVLEDVVGNGKLFEIVDYIKTKDPEKITRLNKKYRSEGLEGIMVKKINGTYVPGRTGWRWVKMKEAESEHAKLADTVDAVVMGYTRGKGRRAEFGVGQFLVGIMDGEKIKTITKVGTGLTDKQFRELNKRLEKIRVSKKPKEYEVNKILEPDFWVRPSQIVEIAADELTKSPSHTSGYALRFPRLVKFRDDKGVDQATSLEEIVGLSSI